jgi:hypothetical protein
MKNGIYAVQFGVGATMSKGSGVIVYRDGNVRGGDAGYAYIGNVSGEGGSLSGELEIVRHTPGYPSVFGDVDSFQLSVTGNEFPNDTAGFDAGATAFPGHRLKISMQLIRAD